MLFFIINKYIKGKINKVIKKLYLFFLKKIKAKNIKEQNITDGILFPDSITAEKPIIKKRINKKVYFFSLSIIKGIKKTPNKKNLWI